MKFKNWLNEMGYIVFDKDVQLDLPIKGPVDADMIDMRYEIYPPGIKDESHPDKPIHKLRQYDPIIAKIPNSHNSLVWNGQQYIIRPLPEEEKQELKQTHVEMPDIWWKYAKIMKGNNVVN